ncbi:MAG: outer membrane beta-barrel protein [Planctomycetota bacterium]
MTPIAAGRMLALLIAISAATPSAEPVVRDLVLAFEFRPTAYDYHYTAPTVDRSGDDDFETAFALSLSGHYGFSGAGSPHALVLGIGATAGERETANVVSHRTHGLRSSVGYACAFSDRVILHAAPVLEFGLASIEFDATTTYDGFSSDGTYIAWGAQLRGTYALADHWAINASAGYIWSSATLDDGDVDLGLDQDGLLVGIGLTWRLSSRPSVLW